MIELLEPRIAPAAIIDIVSKGGNATLKIHGNTDTIENLSIVGDTDGDLTITGNNGESFVVNGVAGNGPITLADIWGDLSIALGKNDDALTLTNVVLGGKLIVKMGEGANATTLTGCTIGDSLTYTGGKGADTLTIDGSAFELAGALNFTGAAGSNLLKILASSVHVGGNVKYSGGAGDDLLSIASTVVSLDGNLTFLGGTSASGINITAQSFNLNKSLTLTAGPNLTSTPGGLLIDCVDFLHLGGSLNYSNPSGKQMFELSSDTAVQIGGSVTIKAAPTDDTTFSLDGGVSLATGKVSITSKGAHIAAEIGASQIAVSGSLSITGVRTVELSGFGTIGGPTLLSSTQQAKIIAPDGTPLTFAGPFVYKTPTAAATTSLFRNVRFLGLATITLGSAADTVTLDNIDAFGSFTLNSGKGNDDIKFETTAAAGTSFTFRPVVFNLGAGADSLIVGSADAKDTLISYRSFLVTGGKSETVSLLNGTNVFLTDPVVR